MSLHYAASIAWNKARRSVTHILTFLCHDIKTLVFVNKYFNIMDTSDMCYFEDRNGEGWCKDQYCYEAQKWN